MPHAHECYLFDGFCRIFLLPFLPYGNIHVGKQPGKLACGGNPVDAENADLATIEQRVIDVAVGELLHAHRLADKAFGFQLVAEEFIVVYVIDFKARVKRIFCRKLSV